jgi:predicted acyl esterase
LSAWEGYQKASALPWQAKLVVDPCGHCQDAAAYFPSNAVLGRAALPLLMALELIADDSVTNRTWPAPAEGVQNVTFYVMGADEVGTAGNYWTTMGDFPTPTPTQLFLTQAGALSPSPPTAPDGALRYAYNPADPVPTVGGDNLEIKCGPLDQRKIEDLKRGDVLVFTSAPLREPLAITGGPVADIFMSTSVVDTDVVVKLIDVYPAADPGDPLFSGASILVLDGISRMKWRNWRTDNAEALLSGDPADVYATKVGLWNTSYVFNKGHSIRVHVSSSNHPRFLPNPNTGDSFGSSNITAHTTIHLSSAHPSSITLPVVPLAALPPFPIEDAVDALEKKFAPEWAALTEERRGGAAGLGEWLSGKFEKATAAHRARWGAKR